MFHNFIEYRMKNKDQTFVGLEKWWASHLFFCIETRGNVHIIYFISQLLFLDTKNAKLHVIFNKSWEFAFYAIVL